MFQKILIANRGEIACRLIQTFQRLGIQTIAVYSQADANAKFVKLSDEAYPIGDAPAASSYLSMDKILCAAQESGAQAIHPGYGFLSENAEFARRVQALGMAFIGPNPDVIELMGDKILSKKAAIAAGVHVVPGIETPLTSVSQAQEAATKIGFPVLIKAAAGGGGKGMRVVKSATELPQAMERAQSEAQSSFGDNRVFLEKYIAHPRHIEIQILGDTHGNVIHLGERECSLQRRHQKVIEEAPSPFLTPETRKAMTDQAVALAKKVGYTSAGTVEFIVDAQQNFYFLEMNTRLQVEHPVTEYVTGLDLVSEMVHVAAGKPLSHHQSDIQTTGWALEARLYAEDPDRGFVPCLGRITGYQEPSPNPHHRIDSGIEAGDLITPYYDPLLAKVIAHGPTREDARRELLNLLDAYCVHGFQTNQAYLARVLNHPKVIAGDLSTHFLEEHADELAPHRGAVPVTYLVAAALVGKRLSPESLETAFVVRLGDDFYPLTLHENTLCFENKSIPFQGTWDGASPIFTLDFSGVVHTFQVHVHQDTALLIWFQGGISHPVTALSPRTAELLKGLPQKVASATHQFLKSPMPGLVVSLPAQMNQTVAPGDSLIVIEAMKMENILIATGHQKIARILVNKGDNVDADQPLIEFA